jgi:hypothetical protein
MCRNIRTLYNFDPPASEDEIKDAALQFVRKVSGYRTPSKANQGVYDHAVEEISLSVQALLSSLVTAAPARDRKVEAEKAKQRSIKRFN